MEDTQLQALLKDRMRSGFDADFAAFCADTLASHHYTSENLARARRHALYLRLILELLTSEDEPVPGENANAPSDVAIMIGKRCYEKSLQEGIDFCREFIKEWCSYWAD